MRALSLLLPAGIVMVAAFDGMAADFDGSKPFLCATADVSSCVPGQDCARESAQTVSAPPFFVVDVGKRLVSELVTASTVRTSKIQQIEHQSGLLMLSGTDGDQGWVVTVGEVNGKLSYAVIGDRVVIAAFGSCLSQK